MSLGPPSGLGADNQERLRRESEAMIEMGARSVGKTASMPTCRKCGQTIVGPGFGSPETGWEHPFDGCPRLSLEAKMQIEREAVERSPYKSSSTCRVCRRFLQDTSTPEVQRIRESAQGCCDSHLSPDPEPFFAIRRLDGELVYGEFSWVKCDGPDDWDAADESEHDDDTEYEIVEMRPRRVAARRYFGSMLCPDCSGDGWLPDSGEDGEVEVTCSTCRGSGERDEKWEGI